MKGAIFVSFYGSFPSLRLLIAVLFPPLPLCRENAILSRGLDECQARLVVWGSAMLRCAYMLVLLQSEVQSHSSNQDSG